MKQLKFTFLLTVLMSMVGIKAFTHDFEVDGMYYNIVSISDLTCEVTYQGSEYLDQYTYSGEITVPEVVHYNGRSLKVVGIGDYAFDNYNWWNKKKEPITSIKLPDCIEYIGKSALANNSFTDFIVPRSLKRIRSNAFKRYVSEGIKRVYINNLESWCKIIFDGDSSSPFCNGARNEGTATTYGLNTTEAELYLDGHLCETITIPHGVRAIGNYAFAGIKQIKEVILPEGIESIGDFAFANCSNLRSIKTPCTCLSIGEHAFNGCSILKEVQLSEGLESIGERSFSYCFSLLSLSLPSTIETIGAYLFYGMKLPYLKIKYSNQPLFLSGSSLFNVNTIDFQRDFYCSYYFTLNNGEICRSPFEGYEGGKKHVLKNIYLRSQVSHVPRRIFNGCSLDTVFFEESKDPIKIGYCRADSSYSYTSSYSCTSAFYRIPIKYLHLGREMEINKTESMQGAKDQNLTYYYGDFFNESTSFEEIVLGNGIKDISFLHYGKYMKLYNVTFGKGIASIPNLSSNEKLDKIVIINDTPPNAVGFANTTYLHANLYVPKGCKDNYTKADIWKNFWNIMELDEDFETLKVVNKNTKDEAKALSYYNIDGTKNGDIIKKGIIIIKMSDGTTKKVFVK